MPNDENQTITVNGGQSQESAIVANDPNAQVTYPFSKGDIKAIAKQEVEEEIAKGSFDGIVQANPEVTGTEPDLEALKVGGVKYKIPSGTNVAANPTLAGTESELTGLEVGNTKYKVPQPTEVVANPTLAGTESDLTGLQVGNTKYAIPQPSAGGTLHCFKLALSLKRLDFYYFTETSDFVDKTALRNELRTRSFPYYNCIATPANPSTDGKFYKLNYFDAMGFISGSGFLLNITISTLSADPTTGAISSVETTNNGFQAGFDGFSKVF